MLLLLIQMGDVKMRCLKALVFLLSTVVTTNLIAAGVYSLEQNNIDFNGNFDRIEENTILAEKKEGSQEGNLASFVAEGLDVGWYELNLTLKRPSITEHLREESTLVSVIVKEGDEVVSNFEIKDNQFAVDGTWQSFSTTFRLKESADVDVQVVWHNVQSIAMKNASITLVRQERTQTWIEIFESRRGQLAIYIDPSDCWNFLKDCAASCVERIQDVWSSARTKDHRKDQ